MRFPLSFESRNCEPPRLPHHNDLLQALNQLRGVDFVDAILAAKIDVNTILIFEEHEEPNQGNDGSPEFHYHFNTAMNIATVNQDIIAIEALLKHGASAARYIHLPDGSTDSWKYNRVGYRIPSEEWHILNLCDDAMLRAKKMPKQVSSLAIKSAVDEIFAAMKHLSQKPPWLKIAALFYFISKGDKTAVRTLLESGVSPDSFGPGGMSAVGLAIREKNLEILKLLKSSGADFGGPSAWNHPRHVGYYPDFHTKITPLLWASAFGFLDGVKLIQEASVDAKRVESLTAAINFTMSQLRSNPNGLIKKLPPGVKDTMLFLGAHLISGLKTKDALGRPAAAEALLKIIIEITGKNWKEAEDYFKNDAWTATKYAAEVIGKRWPPGEESIARNALCSYFYATDVIRGRWQPGEKAILSDPFHALGYVRDVLKKRWPEAEVLFLKNPSLACSYAEDVIKGPWPEAEGIIKTDANTAVRYAQYVIKGRWLEAEDVIMQNSSATEIYKVHVHRITPKAVCCIKPWEPLKNCPKGPTGCDHYKRMHSLPK